MNFSRLGRFECPICTNKIVVAGENDLESQYPDLAIEFDIKKNGITPDKVAFSYTNEEMWWKCAEGHEFQRSVWYRVNQAKECPICNRSIIVKGINDFQTSFPDVIKAWDYEKNERGPDVISDISNRKFSFKCDYGHHYETLLRTAIANSFQCMVCNRKIIQEGVNSLFDTDPDLAKEFSPNEERSPSEFAKNNAYSIIWQCPTCGGEYRYPINEREVGDDSCPYCKGTKLLPGYNSFKIKHPYLMEEWDYVNNYLLCDANHILDNSNDKVWWNCKDCNHKYYMSPKQRVYYQKRHKLKYQFTAVLSNRKNFFYFSKCKITSDYLTVLVK